MVGAGLLMILFSLIALFIDLRNLYRKFSWFLIILPWAIVLALPCKYYRMDFDRSGKIPVGGL